MIRILSAAVSLEGMPNANGLLTIPRGVVQARRRQVNGARRHRRQVHGGIRVVLHRRRVCETRGTRTTVAETRTSMTLTRGSRSQKSHARLPMQEDVDKSHATSCAILYTMPMAVGEDFFARSLAKCL